MPAARAPVDNPAGTDYSLFSMRSLLIITLAMMTGLISALGTGIPVGLAARAESTAWAIAIGMIAGLGTAVTVGLSVAAALHLLVSKSD